MLGNDDGIVKTWLNERLSYWTHLKQFFRIGGGGLPIQAASGRGICLRMLWHGIFCFTPSALHG
jgi:hypothetical protein